MYSATSINDLSDNGKSFEFGYDSENDSYGYYKNGTFTEFGGGGGLSTKCIVKGIVCLAASTVALDYFIADDDGTIKTGHATDVSNLANILSSQVSFIQSVSANTGYAFSVTVAKDGYYTCGDNSSKYWQPTFFSAGQTIPGQALYTYYQNGYLAYYGMEVPN